MKLPWRQLGAILLILAIGVASAGPPPNRGGQARWARNESWLAHQPTVRKMIPADALRNVSFSASAATRMADVAHATTMLALGRISHAGHLAPTATHVAWRVATTGKANLACWTSGLNADVGQAAWWQSLGRPPRLTNLSPPDIIGMGSSTWHFE